MNELTFGFFDCALVPQGPTLVIPASLPEESFAVSIQDQGNSTYTYIEEVACKLCKWVTVNAIKVYRVAVCMIRAFVRAILPTCGVQVLRRSAILNI